MLPLSLSKYRFTISMNLYGFWRQEFQGCWGYWRVRNLSSTTPAFSGRGISITPRKLIKNAHKLRMKYLFLGILGPHNWAMILHEDRKLLIISKHLKQLWLIKLANWRTRDLTDMQQPSHRKIPNWNIQGWCEENLKMQY